MRIALVAPPWLPIPPTGYGGTETVVDCLARGLDKAGHEVMLFTVPESTCPVPKKSVLKAADPTRMNWSEVELRHVIHAYEAAQDFDIVHDHTMLGPIYANRYPHIPVVTTQHHPYNDSFRDIFRASSQNSHLIAISHTQRKLSKDLPIAKVIHHGIDPAQFEFRKKPEDYFLFLGRMSRDKGVHTAALAAKKSGARLKIAARMSSAEGEREYFEKEVEPLLDDRIQYVGEANWWDKQQLLAGAKALLVPIQWPEPFGLVMIESMACGTPVIAFRSGAAPEIVDHGVTGFICDDVDDMVARIIEVDDLDRSACRRSVEEYFSMKRMTAEHIAFYEQILAEKADGGASSNEPSWEEVAELWSGARPFS